MSLSKPFGDVTDIECPSETEPGKFVKVGQIQSGDDRATLSLEGRHALDLRSTLLSLAKRRCPADVQIHYSDCEDLSQFNLFKKVLFLEDSLLTEYGTEDLGALEDDQQSAVNETAPVSARILYDYIPLSFGGGGEDVVTNPLLDVVICDDVSCGSCTEESDGCEKIYAISTAAGGSPGTPPDVVFSLDGGATWYAHDIDTMLTAEVPSAIACVGQYIVVVSNETNSLHYVLQSQMTNLVDPAFTEVATGFVAGGEPNDMWSVGNKAWIVGDLGYVYVLTDPTAGVSVQDAGEATISQLNAVHALSANFAVAVGNDGEIIVSENGTNWAQTVASPVGVGTALTSVWVKSKTEWWVTSDAGNLYYTLDGGETWTIKAFDGSGAGTAEAIVFATSSIAYLSHTTAAPLGRLLASFDGGYSWIVLPQTVGLMPDNDEFTAIAACQAEPKLLVAVGDADGVDGIIVVGES
jgi:photosystem II stability/assembly factor-like uncharacterized protein